MAAALVAAALLAGIGAFGFGLAAFVRDLDHDEREPASPADGIVALTGGAQRIEDAVDLLARGYGRRLLITGVNMRTDRDAIARLTPNQRSLVECCVDLDYRAQNTIGNAVETERWASRNGFRSLIVVTSNYHMPRTMAELDRVLPETRKASHPVTTPAVDTRRWWGSPTAIRVLSSEYAKYLAAGVRRRLASKAPEQPSAVSGRNAVAGSAPPR
jgi:uncharacterized SAM-binding protein YcdF (DUF218 family)